MKQWLIGYSVRFIDGKIEERQKPITAPDIGQAMVEAQREIVDPLRLADPTVSEVAIWDVILVTELEDPAAVF